jgi:CBS domain-containing protein
VKELLPDDVVTVKKEATLEEAARRLTGLRISGMPVVFVFLPGPGFDAKGATRAELIVAWAIPFRNSIASAKAQPCPDVFPVLARLLRAIAEAMNDACLQNSRLVKFFAIPPNPLQNLSSLGKGIKYRLHNLQHGP